MKSERSCWFRITFVYLSHSDSFSFLFFSVHFALLPSPFSFSFGFRRLHFAYSTYYITCWYTLWHRCIDETNLFRRKEKEKCVWKGICIIRANTQTPSTLISIYRASHSSYNSNTNVTFSLSSIFIRRAVQTCTHTHSLIGHKQKSLFDNERMYIYM